MRFRRGRGEYGDRSQGTERIPACRCRSQGCEKGRSDGQTMESLVVSDATSHLDSGQSLLRSPFQIRCKRTDSLCMFRSLPQSLMRFSSSSETLLSTSRESKVVLFVTLLSPPSIDHFLRNRAKRARTNSTLVVSTRFVSLLLF